jgi:MipA family protein
MNHNTHIVILGLLTSVSIATTAYANDFLADGKQDTPQETSAALHGFFGVGAGMVNEYEGSKDFQTIPFIAGRVSQENRYIEMIGLGVRANILNDEHLQFGPVVNFRFGRDDDVDNVNIAALQEVDNAFEAGAFMRYDYSPQLMTQDSLGFEGRYLQDISSAHDGFEASIGVNYNAPITQRLRLGADIGTSFANDDYMQTYYSVIPQNVGTSNFSAYDADSGFKNASIGLNGQYTLTQRWGIFSRASYSRLLGDAADTPIVSDEGSANQFLFGTGVSYRF